MKTNKTEINFDQLEKVTGGITDVAWPVKSGLTQNGTLTIGSEIPPKAGLPGEYPYMTNLVQDGTRVIWPNGLDSCDPPRGIGSCDPALAIGSCDPAVMYPPKKSGLAVRV